MNQYAFGQSDSVVSAIASVIPVSLYPATPTASPTIDTSSLISETVTKTDEQYYVNPVNITGLSSKASYNKAISLTWSSLGTTSIKYSLIGFQNQQIPLWINFDSTNEQIKFTTPWVLTDTNYMFLIMATINGLKTQTLVTLTVTPLSTG